VIDFIQTSDGNGDGAALFDMNTSYQSRTHTMIPHNIQLSSLIVNITKLITLYVASLKSQISRHAAA